MQYTLRLCGLDISSFLMLGHFIACTWLNGFTCGESVVDNIPLNAFWVAIWEGSHLIPHALASLPFILAQHMSLCVPVLVYLCGCVACMGPVWS